MRSKMSKRELLIVFIILAVCLAATLFYYFNRSTGEITTAQIYYNGELIREISLSQTEDQVITLDENDKVHVEIKDHKIRFINVDCPDKICEHEGYLYKDGDIAVCMPNKIHIKIESETK